MSFLSLLFYILGGILFTAASAVVVFQYPDQFSWPIWIVLACGYAVALKMLWLKIQIWWFGPRLIIDVTKYDPPPVCPVNGTPASLERFIEHQVSGAAGPIHFHQTHRFPVLLSDEAAAVFDRAKIFKKVPGLTLRRVAYDKFYLHCKSDAYRKAMLEANAESKAVIGR